MVYDCLLNISILKGKRISNDRLISRVSKREANSEEDVCTFEYRPRRIAIYLRKSTTVANFKSHPFTMLLFDKVLFHPDIDKMHSDFRVVLCHSRSKKIIPLKARYAGKTALRIKSLQQINKF